MRVQPLTLTYQDLLNMSKIHETSLASYHKSQESIITTETNTITTVKQKKHDKLNSNPTIINEMTIQMSTTTTKRPMTEAILPIEHHMPCI